jgi:hypothetical protein
MLAVRKQLALAGWEAPTAVRRLRKRSATWLGVYLVAATVLLGLVASYVVAHSGDLKAMVLDYVVPKDWQFAARIVIDRFFKQQESIVVINAALSASLMAVQITLFPIKEHVSAALETDAQLVDEPMQEFPLWFQAWEEVKLFLFMLAAQGTIFWIGYSDEPLRRTLATVLSFLVLFVSVGIDFLSPVLQRHKLRYSTMIKTYLAHPVLLLGFGALFALPSIVVANIAADHPTWSLTTQLGVSFGTQIIGIALAAIGGTVAGAPLIADAKNRSRSSLPVRIGAWVVLLSLLGWNTYRFVTVGRSVHHKSQILKVHYAVDWNSFRAETPSALDLVTGVRNDRITVAVEFDVTITNTTSTDLEIENNHLDVRQNDQLIATTSLPKLRVAAGTSQKVTVKLPLTVAPSQVLRLRELLTTKGWSLTLWLEVADGWQFPVYLMTKN